MMQPSLTREERLKFAAESYIKGQCKNQWALLWPIKAAAMTGTAALHHKGRCALRRFVYASSQSFKQKKM
ncbi:MULTISPECIES: hypothetical protein [unclassified Mesorhizobium]|uniref:hypothetical protein n=1 Tax=unclassified Mesorhizobium TaxID=325217 RepID=UPI001AD58353|nr:MULTISPECIES: hypothetical protein [unclassified Mesorhizobium]MBN9253818.1 hypothetical protein [Mesorhizobium sp.]